MTTPPFVPETAPPSTQPTETYPPPITCPPVPGRILRNDCTVDPCYVDQVNYDEYTIGTMPGARNGSTSLNVVDCHVAAQPQGLLATTGNEPVIGGGIAAGLLAFGVVLAAIARRRTV